MKSDDSKIYYWGPKKKFRGRLEHLTHLRESMRTVLREALRRIGERNRKLTYGREVAPESQAVFPLVAVGTVSASFLLLEVAPGRTFEQSLVDLEKGSTASRTERLQWIARIQTLLTKDRELHLEHDDEIQTVQGRNDPELVEVLSYDECNLEIFVFYREISVEIGSDTAAARKRATTVLRKLVEATRFSVYDQVRERIVDVSQPLFE